MSRTCCQSCGAPTQGDLCGFCRGAGCSAPSAIGLIAEERRRQVAGEGWSERHDDTHTNGELVLAAVAYLDTSAADIYWPWDMVDFKPVTGDRIRELVKAGALVAAEIDRLLRAKP